jgi:hypothetical protein
MEIVVAGYKHFILVRQNYQKILKKIYQFNIFFQAKSTFEKHLKAEAEIILNTV